MSNDSAADSSLVDLAALGKMLQEHWPALRTIVHRRLDPRLANRIDPEEVLGEAFLRARHRWAKFTDRAEQLKRAERWDRLERWPYVWLYGIVRDCLIDAWRRETRLRRDVRQELPFPEDTSIQLGLGLVSPGTSPSEAVARQEAREQMRALLGLLKDEHREMLWMRHYDGLTHAEAAEVLGISENAATVRYARALQRLTDLWRGLSDRAGVATDD
jgi:RNA polymerase sigma-70 factor (ECF subfamily)